MNPGKTAPALSFFAALLAMAGGIAHLVWWQLAHNLINVSCSNNIYFAHHVQPCAVWSRACGIVMGVDMPLIVFGIFGAIAAGLWYVSRLD